MARRHVIGAVVAAFAIAAVLNIVSKVGARVEQIRADEQATVDVPGQLKNAVAEFLRKTQLPLKIDDDTTLVEAYAKDSAIYYVNQVDLPAGGTLPLDEAKPEMAKSWCSNDYLKMLTGRGASAHYVYKDRDGGDVGEVVIDAC